MRKIPVSGVVAAAAALVSLCALWLTASSLRALKSGARVELAMSLQRQFDGEYKQDRAECARAFLYSEHAGKKRKKGLAEAPYAAVMDFFDSVGYLVERGALDEPLARYYFSYPLDGYFTATQALLRRDQKLSPRRYERVFRLAARWRDEDEARPDLIRFFEEELDFAEPPPPDEGPRT
jgi:hypothetical protein